jgi:hypothetical protein
LRTIRSGLPRSSLHFSPSVLRPSHGKVQVYGGTGVSGVHPHPPSTGEGRFSLAARRLRGYQQVVGIRESKRLAGLGSAFYRNQRPDSKQVGVIPAEIRQEIPPILAELIRRTRSSDDFETELLIRGERSGVRDADGSSTFDFGEWWAQTFSLGRYETHLAYVHGVVWIG